MTSLDSFGQDLSDDVQFDWFMWGLRFPIVFGNDIIITSVRVIGFPNLHLL